MHMTGTQNAPGHRNAGGILYDHSIDQDIKMNLCEGWRVILAQITLGIEEWIKFVSLEEFRASQDELLENTMGK